MVDYWPDLYEDPYALKRLKQSVALADIKKGHSVLDVGGHKGEARKLMPEVNYVCLDAFWGHDIDGGFMLGQKFDRILCLETLEHLKYPRKTLRSIVNYLKDDGLCVVSLPNEATLFHRLRCILGTVDGESFSESGKHLHLPNTRQANQFLEQFVSVKKSVPYLNLSGAGSRQQRFLKYLELIPSAIWQVLLKGSPSLFARGTIFVCQKKRPSMI